MFHHLSLILLCAGVGSLSAEAGFAQGSQTLPSGYDTLEGNGSSSYPFNSTGNQSWQWHYDSGQFEMDQPILITEVYVRTKSSSAPITFDFPTVELTMASSPTDYTVLGQGGQLGHDNTYANNLNPDAAVVRASAPFTGTAVPALTWMAIGLDEPYLYDPTVGNDFVLEIRKCSTNSSWGASIDGRSDSAGLNGGNRYGHTSDCASLVSTFSNNEFVPFIKIDWIPTGPAMHISPMVAGELTDFTFEFVDPGGMIFIRWSTAGPGPTPTVIGDLALTEPIHAVPVVHADLNGELNFSTFVPASLLGETFFCHSVVQRDGGFELTNPMQLEVQ
ncbi:MAG: hypothetical protein ACPG31_13435 [Planctomycetota bacterium]